jgi:hypothetical protein
MKGPNKTGCKITVHLLVRVLLVAVIVIAVTNNVQADGGIVLWQRITGSFTVTVFATQAPLRAGPADISILVEDAGEPRAVMDARVFIELQHDADATVTAEATHRQARNKLLYCSLISLPEAGNWKLKIIVEHDGERAETMGDLTVDRPLPMLLSYWKLIAFPPVVMILFIINQWLCRSRIAVIN